MFSKKSKNLMVLTFMFQVFITLTLLQMSRPLEALQLQLTFFADEANQLINFWSPQDLYYFQAHYLFDYIYPFIYAGLLYNLLKDLSSKLNVKKIAYGAAALDLIENTFHLLMVKKIIGVQSVAVFLAASAASLKWLLILFLIVLVIANLGQRFKKRF